MDDGITQNLRNVYENAKNEVSYVFSEFIIVGHGCIQEGWKEGSFLLIKTSCWQVSWQVKERLGSAREFDYPKECKNLTVT